MLGAQSYGTFWQSRAPATRDVSPGRRAMPAGGVRTPPAGLGAAELGAAAPGRLPLGGDKRPRAVGRRRTFLLLLHLLLLLRLTSARGPTQSRAAGGGHGWGAACSRARPGLGLLPPALLR